MNPGDLILLAVVGVLASNHVLVRLPGWERRPALFWGAQVANLAAAVYVMGVGIPGLDGDISIFNWIFGLLFVVRIVQNNQRYSAARREASRGAASTADARRERIHEALAAGDRPAEGGAAAAEE